MSIHYLLDGYNVIHKMPSALNRTKLEECRRALIRYIEQYNPQGSSRNKVTVIFDGNMETFGGMRSSVAKVIFSQGESADDTIKKFVSKAQDVKSLIVVSDDRDIQYAVRALGAKISSVRGFLAKAKIPGKAKHAIHESSRGSKGGLEEAPKHISKTEEFKITSEFKGIWLNSVKKRKN